MRRTLAVLLLAASSCATVVADDLVVDGYPPDGFIATATPIYYEGHAAYWYRDRWYWRDGGRWHGYHDEPVYLHDARVRAPPVRQFYGRAHGGGYRRR